MATNPRVVLSLTSYQPQCDVLSLTREALASVPSGRLAGLESVTLRDLENLTRREKRGRPVRGGKRRSLTEVFGVYYPGDSKQAARIELFVDNIFSRGSRWMQRINFVRDLYFTRTLYHEIGHHIHSTSAPEYEDREKVAKKWQERLQRSFFQTKYRRYLPLLRVLHALLKSIQWVSRLFGGHSRPRRSRRKVTPEKTMNRPVEAIEDPPQEERKEEQ